MVELTITDSSYSEDTLVCSGVYKKDPWLDFSNAVEVWPGPDEYDLIDRISGLDTNEDGWITASDSCWSLEDGDLVYETHSDAQTLRLVGVNGFSVDALDV